MFARLEIGSDLFDWAVHQLKHKNAARKITGAFANLGRSEEANIDAIAAGLAAVTIAKERGRNAVQAQIEESREQAGAVLTGIFRSESVERFLMLKEKLLQSITSAFAEVKAERADAIEGITLEGIQAMTSDEVGQVFDALSDPEFGALAEDVRRAIADKLTQITGTQ